MVCFLLNVFALTDSAVYCNENKPTHSLCICIVYEKTVFLLPCQITIMDRFEFIYLFKFQVYSNISDKSSEQVNKSCK